MMGRMDLEKEDCPDCAGTGKDPRKRTRPCKKCNGDGKHAVCKHCGGIYGTECIDDTIDQTYCSNKE